MKSRTEKGVVNPEERVIDDNRPRIVGPEAGENMVWRYIGSNYVQFFKMKLRCADVEEWLDVTSAW